MSLVNTQIEDSVNTSSLLVVSGGPAISNNMTYLALAGSLSTLMQNSAVTQFNSQTVGVAALTQTCALIISAAAGAK